MLSSLMSLVLVWMGAAMDLDALWDFQDPAGTEQRMRAELESAAPNDRLVLQTQIARTLGLRGKTEDAAALLDGIRDRVTDAQDAEVSARFHLEYGRVLVSATRPPDVSEPERTDEARAHYQRATEIARESGLDALAIDALHMMAFLEDDPDTQLGWAREALAIATSSDQPRAQRWEASLRHNAGYALHQMQRFAEALEQFERARALRADDGTQWQQHVAGWMVAWTLRSLGRLDEALALQHELEAGREAAGQPDRFVFEELATLYREKGDAQQADHYQSLAEAQAK